ncbi:hypothetical protein CDAR_579421 [Caerostris darwini]|uniref:Uncharacterized protein n=1 Tax=Caerostris darwini TaxID=1538125 RepID=A0AAV4V2E5_9ARAC|nr:hypothetical protein CDAR_579421 [Caerostris darwini]
MPPLKFDGGEQFFYIPVPASSSTVKFDLTRSVPLPLGSDLKTSTSCSEKRKYFVASCVAGLHEAKVRNASGNNEASF